MASSKITNNIFIRKSYSCTISSIGANGTKNITADDFGFSTPSGYIAIGIRMFASDTSNLSFYRINPGVSGDGIAVQVRNISGGTITDITIDLQVMYAPTAMVKL